MAEVETKPVEEPPLPEGEAKEGVEGVDGELKKKKKKSTKKPMEMPGELAGDSDLAAFCADLKKKKKKKPKEGAEEKGEEGAKAPDSEAPKEDGNSASGEPKEYTYEFLLQRVFKQISASGRDCASIRRYTLKPPKVQRDGPKKTAFTNFKDICESMHRQQDHVLAFLYAELQTQGAIDGNECLILRGKFNQRSMENLIRKYINEYVLCAMCHALETTLVKDPHTRLYQLQCNSCGASRTVQAISSGYHAQVGKRKKNP